MKKAIIFIFILLIVVLGLLFYIQRDPSTPHSTRSSDSLSVAQDRMGKLKITFLDIGQGDATFIEFPDGQQMLVDCAVDGRILEALGRVMDFYDRDIDYLVVTHPDLDHYGGCSEVLSRFEVKNIIYNGLKKEYDDFWVEFWDMIQAEQTQYIEVGHEDVWEMASTTMRFLYPDHSISENSNIPENNKETDSNNTSIVFELEYGGKEILMTGDMGEELESYLLATYGEQLDTDILKIAHHGSGGSSVQEFVDMTSPKYAIISAGLNNKFGHPSPRVLKRLERASSTILRTDLQGDIVLWINRDGQVEIE